jgi:hypothetical protein
MGTGLLRRHREELTKLREEEAALEITEIATVVHESELIAEPTATVAEAVEDTPRTKRANKKTQEYQE